MKPKEPFTINLNVDWHVLAVLGIAAVILVFAFSAVSAQDGAPLDINSPQAQPIANPPEQDPGTLPTPFDLQCSDGLLPTTNGECIPADSLGVAPSSASGEVGISAAGAGGHHFYLTKSNYATNTALTACGSGYHMASLWEILDVSNLTYDYNNPDATTKDDSGYGPPSLWYGWVRTGWGSSGINVVGSGNCLNWSSAIGTDYGVSVRLSNTWVTAPGDISTWDATSFACTSIGPVWCVGN